MKINIVEGAKYIIDRLYENGFEGFVVGGCVRDSILGYTPKDWDITTNATPIQVKDIFKELKVIPTGEKYGTLTLIHNNEQFEVTTYRKDCNYSDGRRPDKVYFSDNIYDDLSRRDFTINAMAYNDKVSLIDPYNGIKDINRKQIKCVGNAEDRFTEDGLRIMRCVRFACKYNFNIEIETYLAMNKSLDMLDKISKERISSELKQILEYSTEDKCYVRDIIFKVIPELKETINFEQNNPYHYLDVCNHIFKSMYSNESNNFIIRMTMLLHDIAKPQCYTQDENGIGHFYSHAEQSSIIAKDILTRLRYDNNTINTICTLIKYHDYEIVNKNSLKRLINKICMFNVFDLLKVKICDIKAQSDDKFEVRNNKINEVIRWYAEILREKEVTSIKDLKIKGNDIITITGFKQGKIIGDILNDCLDMVIDEKLNNEYEDLKQYIINKYVK